MKEFLNTSLIICMLLGLFTYTASAAVSPKMKVIATETATEVTVEIKASGDIAAFKAFEMNIGYTTEKLALKTGSVNFVRPEGWTLDTVSDNTVYNNTEIGYVKLSNAWYSLGTGGPIAVVAGTDVLVASLTFTKKATVTASDIFQSPTGFKYGVAPAMVAYSWIYDGLTEINMKTTNTLIEHTFIPNQTNPDTPDNTEIKASIITASPNVVFDTNNMIGFDIYAEKFTDVKNFMIDVSYDPLKLELQNKDSDKNMYLLNNDGAGNIRIVATLDSKLSSEAVVKIFTVNFKMKDAAKNQTTTVTLNHFFAGIATATGQEVTAAISQGTTTISMNEFTFSYDINGNEKIDMGDLVYAESFLGAKMGDTNWNTAIKADASADGQVTVLDLINISIYIAAHK